MQSQIILKNFSKAADTYLNYSDVQNQVAKNLISIVNSACSSKEKILKILDIGSGPGNYTQLLAENFEKSEIYAFDISQEMINFAKQNNTTPRINYFQADGENFTNIIPQKFDLITSNASIQWFQNMDKPLDDYKKILNENGQIIFSVFGPKTFFELNESLQALNLTQSFDYHGATKNIAAANFRSEDDIKDIISQKFKKFKITEKIITKDYENLVSLIKTIKKTGTQGNILKKSNSENNSNNSNNSNNFQKIWTTHMFTKLEEIYIQKFGKITATYHLIFCEME